MISNPRILIFEISLGLLLLLANSGWAMDSREPLQPLKEGAIASNVTDLHFGDVLYEYYQNLSFDSLIRLLAYSKTDRIPSQKLDAELLEAGLWLELGLHQQATEYLERILSAPIPESRKQIAQLFLARIWYRRGDDKKVADILEPMTGELSAAMQAERVHLLSNVLIRLGRYSTAANILSTWSGSGDWVFYARFNLGVALLSDHQVDAGTSYLGELGRLNSTQADLMNLRDRSNLALGFALLDIDKPADAQTYFRRVRLSGPYANRAMLGSGWADALQSNYREALTPWLTLSEKRPVDAAVLESLVAVPHLYELLGAPAQAAENYESAVAFLRHERAIVEQALNSKLMTQQLQELLAIEDEQQADIWLNRLLLHPEAPEARYLYEIFAGSEFQEARNIYKETLYLSRVVEGWRGSLNVNREILGLSYIQAPQEISNESSLVNVEVTPENINNPVKIEVNPNALKDSVSALDELDLRMKSIDQRYENLISKINEYRQDQLKSLSDLVDRGLKVQQKVIDDYLSQAYFQLGKIYDRAGLHDEKKSVQQ